MSSSFLGIDIGTQGCRIALVDADGNLLFEASEEFPLSADSRREQSPTDWWKTTHGLLRKMTQRSGDDYDLASLRSVAVTSTSGTVIPLDSENSPLHDALMYSDTRADIVSEECVARAKEYFGDHESYTGFNASSGLCKMLWFIREFPEKASQIQRWVHAADFITGQLCGDFGISDESNALKSGYDIFTRSWPDYIHQKLPLKQSWLPRVVPAGTPIGTIRDDLATEIGLPLGIQVVAGMTDGCTSQIAAGAVKPGDWNTTIGTTLVVKGVTQHAIHDPQGRVYNHRHPEGYFMPGGAGNTGADWVKLKYGKTWRDLAEQIPAHLPSGHYSWPLMTEGERFPLRAPQARGFEATGVDEPTRFLADMEGVAYIERYAYEMLGALSGHPAQRVYTAGGASKNPTWLRIRCNVLGLPIYRMKYVSSAVGAAILAASQTQFSTLSEAAEAMTQADCVVHPDRDLRSAYGSAYNEFVDILRRKGYVNEE